MGWILLIWALKLLAVLGTVEGSYKALKQPKTRKRRIAGQGQGQAAPTSAERMRKRMIKVQLTNWVVLACFLWTERIADRTISWIIPLYDELKILTLLSILVWRSAGAELVFRKIIKPTVTPYERPLDGLSFLVGEALDVILFLVLSGPRWIKNRFSKTATKTEEDEVPAIMRSLRAPGRPPLASHLADSIELTRAHLTHVPEPAPPSRTSSSSTTTTTTTTRVNPLPFRPTLHQSRPFRDPPPPPPTAPVAGPSRVSYRNVYPVLPPPLPKPAPEPEPEPEYIPPQEEEEYVHPPPPPPPAARTTTTTTTRKVSAASTAAAKGKARAVPSATTTTAAPPKRALRSKPDLFPAAPISISAPPPPIPAPAPIPTLSHSHSSSHSLSRSSTPLQPALRNPSVLSLTTSIPPPLPPPSPKQLALSAIRDLSNDVSPFDFSPATTSKGPRKSLLSLPSTSTSTAAPKAETKRKATARVSDESPRKKKTVIVAKEEDEYRPEQDADVDVEDEDEDTSRTRSTASSRKRRVSQLEPSASSSDDGTTTAIESLAPSKKPKSPSPVKKPRLRAPATTKTKSKLPTPTPSTSTEEDAFVVRRPRQAGRVVSSGAPPTRVTAASRVPVVGGVASGSGSGSGSGTTVVRKKARRVLGTNGGVLSDREEEGVPVVKRRRA